ncbi:MAG TPA: zinc metalloprotease HtpX [Candidatus Babeliales bacterium]|nr:zinc metalloprotease HtpX [Candidatus Babeliales bacterium]
MFFNMLKTAVLLIILSGLLLLVGGLIGGVSGIQIALFLSVIMNFITFFFSDRIVLALYKAQPLDKTHYQWIYEIIEELSHKMQLPMPKLWLVTTPMANAFATGRSPKHASIAVTTGILSLLDAEELRGVLAHELAHIKNRDTLITTIAATVASAIGYLAYMLRHMALWGSVSSDRRKENPFALILVSILMPFAATLVQLAISRSREYAADDTGARCSHSPLALASALQKLENNVKYAHMNADDMQQTSTASLFIVHPFTAHSLSSLFATHPPISKRIARLQQLSKKMFS